MESEAKKPKKSKVQEVALMNAPAQTETTPVQAATEAPAVAPQQPPTHGMSTLEKVRYMNDLAMACKDAELQQKILSFPSGTRVYDLLVSSIEREISNIMGGTKDEAITKQVTDLAAVLADLGKTTNQFRYLISSFMQTPLVKTLAQLNQNLGGERVDFTEQAGASQPPTRPAPSMSPEPMPNEVRSNSIRGLGSF